jgi:hypothetical protein
MSALQLSAREGEKRIKKEKGGNVYICTTIYLFIYLFIGYGRSI